jgi:hypothetical protein
MQCLTVCYLLLVIPPVVVYLTVPVLHTGMWALVGLAGVAAILIGIRIHRPAPRWPWLLLAAANLAFTTGDTTYNFLETAFGQSNPFPSLADAFYLSTYPLFAAGVLGFIRHRWEGRDLAGLLDALILTSGLALLSWVHLINPLTMAEGGTWVQRAVALAYPLGDVLVLAMVVRLLTLGGTRERSVQLLALGTVGILTSDVLYGLLQLRGTWQVGTVMDLGWVVFFTAWGLAALHPSMVRLTERVPQPPPGIARRRLAVLAGASLVAPALLLSQALLGSVRDAAVIAVFSGVMFLLVMARLWELVAEHRRVVTRERSLRLAAASLVGAVTPQDVAACVEGAADALFPEGTPHASVLLVVDADRYLRPVSTPRHAWVRQLHHKEGGGPVPGRDDGRPALAAAPAPPAPASVAAPPADATASASASTPAPTGDSASASASADDTAPASASAHAPTGDSASASASADDTAPASASAHGTSAGSPVASPPTGGTRLVDTPELGPGAAADLAPSTRALLCPLALQAPDSPEPALGALLVAGPAGELERLAVSVESLASQAALALERVLDGVNSMTGNLPDLPALARVCRSHDALLYVGDAHGFGVIGERQPGETSPYGSRGNGIVRHFGDSYEGVVLVAGFSKAYSSLLAFVTVPPELKAHLKVAAGPYPYSGPSPTASLATAVAGLDVNERRGDALRADLYRKTRRVLDHVHALGVATPNADGLPNIEIPLADGRSLNAVGDSCGSAASTSPSCPIRSSRAARSASASR